MVQRRRRRVSNLAAVVGPMQQRLPLALAAQEIARLAMALNLPDVPAHRLPAPDLPPVFLPHPTAHVVAAVPLKPAARIVRMDPSLPEPLRQGLAGIDAEIVQRAIAPSLGELGGGEPARGKFPSRVRHVFSAEDAEAKHFFRRQLRPEFPGRSSCPPALSARSDNPSAWRRSP